MKPFSWTVFCITCHHLSIADALAVAVYCLFPVGLVVVVVLLISIRHTASRIFGGIFCRPPGLHGRRLSCQPGALLMRSLEWQACRGERVVQLVSHARPRLRSFRFQPVCA